MTTDGTIIPIERDLDTLLKLDTYQGMSDDEIKKIIGYLVDLARQQAVATAAEADAEFLTRNLQQTSAAQLEQAQANFERACSLNPGFKEVSA